MFIFDLLKLTMHMTQCTTNKIVFIHFLSQFELGIIIEEGEGGGYY